MKSCRIASHCLVALGLLLAGPLPAAELFSDTIGYLNANAATDDGDDSGLQIIPDRRGEWLAVWDTLTSLTGTSAGADIVVSRSSGSGSVWSPPTPISSIAAFDDGGDEDPDAATDGHRNWVIVWESKATSGTQMAGDDADILFVRSTDGGLTWEPTGVLNSNAWEDNDFDPKNEDLNPDVDTNRKEIWITVWQTEFNLGGTLGNDSDLLFARSIDKGATWSIARPLNTNAAFDAGNDNNPRLLYGGGSTWMCVWDTGDPLGGVDDGSQDIAYARSHNDGLTWEAPRTLNSNAPIPSVDLDPSVATDERGNWVVVWESGATLGGTIGVDRDILFARSEDNGETWSEAAPLNTTAATDFTSTQVLHDRQPEIFTDTYGAWVCVWFTTDLQGVPESHQAINMAISTDNGATWTDPVTLDDSFYSQSDLDVDPIVRNDRLGHWIVGWRANNQPGGGIGDTDLLFKPGLPQPIPSTSAKGWPLYD
ncbi:MAG: BNR/Asp-box repeat protein [candidate division BRC1 bacterium ADurb.BinA292]|nr:MAG: BNR/Asp-box repeat protein [candidate division BRC1 bacterium ADurb.BinA292]